MRIYYQIIVLFSITWLIQYLKTISLHFITESDNGQRSNIKILDIENLF